MIRIKNIYYMLAYAFQALKDVGADSFASEDFDNIHELMAFILEKGISNQVKRGLNRDYQPQTEALHSIRGKINTSASINRQTLLNRQLICEYDELSLNTVMNRILKTSMRLLVHHGDVTDERRNALKKLMLYFDSVDTMAVQEIKWTDLNFHRNNATYKMLMNICFLIIKGLLLTEETGEYKLNKFLNDEQMHRLFERFVLAYYRREQPNFEVGASYVNWNVDDGVIDFLPQMKTDITLRYMAKTLIIDTKYYGRTMQNNPQYDKVTLNSANLYQIFTYVKNMDKYNIGNVAGLVLYAKTNEDITPDNDYMMSGNRISVRTIDLSAEWEGITSQLGAIAALCC